MNCQRLYFSVVLLFLVGLPAQAGTMYQCVDESGHKSFSNQKSGPKGTKCTAMDLGAPVNSKRIDSKRIIRIGDQTNLGLVVEIRPPIVKIQSDDKERWVRVEELRKLPTK